jgi:hypothetical protein
MDGDIVIPILDGDVVEFIDAFQAVSFLRTLA